MRKTKKSLLESYSFFHFDDVKEFETFLQNEYEKGDEKIDYVDIGGILYTMEEYDMSGKTISYYNKRTGLGFTVETQDRYSLLGFSDAEVCEPYEVGCWRNDISYID